MANVVSLYDGTTTISLVADGCLLTRYVPTAGTIEAAGSQETVAETVEFVITGATVATVQAKLQAISRLLGQAIEAGGSSTHTAYLLLQATDDAAVWRSEIVAFKILHDEDFAAAYAQAVLGCRLIITRLAFWETMDEVDAGTVHMTNGDVAGGPAVGDWIGPAGPVTYSATFGITEGDNAYNAGEWTAIEGVLRTPAHLRLTNEDGAPVTVKRVYIANDVYARFDGLQHAIQSGDTKSWTTSSTHATARWTLALTAAQIAKLVSGGGVRLLAVMTNISTGVYLRAQLQQVSTGPVVTAAWTGPEALTSSGRLVYDLGYVQMPPGVTTFADWYLVITVYAGATGSGVLDFVQFCPGSELVTLEGPGIAWADDAVIDWWGDERYAAIDDFHASLGAVGRLLLYPERANRLMVLVESATGVDATALMALQVKYRPRRATI